MNEILFFGKQWCFFLNLGWWSFGYEWVTFFLVWWNMFFLWVRLRPTWSNDYRFLLIVQNSGECQLRFLVDHINLMISDRFQHHTRSLAANVLETSSVAENDFWFICSHLFMIKNWIYPPPRLPVTTNDYHIFRIGDPNLNLYLPLASWLGVDLNEDC